MWGKANLKTRIEVAIWLAAAVGAYALTYKFDRVTPMYDWGPAAWPRTLLLAVIAAAAALWWFGGAEENAAPEAPDAPPPDEVDWRHQARRGFIFGVPLLWVFAMDHFGFLLSTPFFLVAYLYLLGFRRWVPIIAIAGAIYVAVVLIFVTLLFTPLPQGSGFFNSLNGELINLLR